MTHQFKPELITPASNRRFTLAAIHNRAGKVAGEAPGSGHILSSALPAGLGVAADGGHALLRRYRQPK